MDAKTSPTLIASIPMRIGPTFRTSHAGLHWDGDYLMTERQCCAMRLLAWCITRNHSSRWATRSTLRGLSQVSALLLNVPDTSKWRYTSRILLKASCPRLAVCCDPMNHHVITISLGGISCTGTVDKVAFEQLRRAQVYMDVAVQVDSLQVCVNALNAEAVLLC